MTPAPPLGHEFGPALCCVGCGVTWLEHQRDPLACERESREGQRERKAWSYTDTDLEALRVAVGMPMRDLASACGISLGTASRAVTGRVGGKGKTSRVVQDQVREYLQGRAGR